MKNTELKIIQIVPLNEQYFQLSVSYDGEFADGDILPGQFFQLQTSAPPFEGYRRLEYPLFRKPFSVYDVDEETKTLTFMIKQVGLGTLKLRNRNPGEKLELLGPLGNGFPITSFSSSVLISGGIGYPPLNFLKRKLLEKHGNVYWLHGGREKQDAVSDVFPCDEVWTDNGDLGNEGFVTEGLNNYLIENTAIESIYACGPDQMLKACSEIAAKHNTELYVSFEDYMVCGIGVCHGCVVRVKADNPTGIVYKTVCKDGPVFNSRDIIWD